MMIPLMIISWMIIDLSERESIETVPTYLWVQRKQKFREVECGGPTPSSAQITIRYISSFQVEKLLQYVRNDPVQSCEQRPVFDSIEVQPGSTRDDAEGGHKTSIESIESALSII